MVVRSEVVFLGGRSGVGKSSVAYEMHAQLSAVGVRHCLIDGDNLGLAFPSPAERNLAARELDALGADRVRRVGTDGRAVADIAAEVVGLVGWVGGG
ncbi:adenylyl-sulfate kinase [Actinoplanes sp. CA-054009]